MLNLPTTRSKSDITMENEGRCHPLCTMYIYTYIHVCTYDEFYLKDPFKVN